MFRSTSTYTRKHWLHKAYLIGFDAGVKKRLDAIGVDDLLRLLGDVEQVRDECPYCCGTKEWDWWWAGWGEGVIA